MKTILDPTLLVKPQPLSPPPPLFSGHVTRYSRLLLNRVVKDNTGGLQIHQHGNWIDVPPVEGVLIVNIGNYMQLLTNDKFKSVEYRALPRPSGTHISAACFFYPEGYHYHSHAICGPIELLSGDNPPLYQNVSFREFLYSIEFQTKYYNSLGLSDFKL